MNEACFLEQDILYLRYMNSNENFRVREIPIKKIRVANLEETNQPLSRQVLRTYKLDQNRLPVFDVDFDLHSFVVGEEGQNILQISNCSRRIVPLFSYNEEEPESQQEDERLFALLDSIRVSDVAQKVEEGDHLVDAIKKAQKKLSQSGYTPSAVIVSPEYVDSGEPVSVDTEAHGSALGMDVYVHPLGQHRDVCVLADPYKVGRFVEDEEEDQIGMLLHSNAVVFLEI